jgi:ribosomal-protein-alanine N-acetyltransferase
VQFPELETSRLILNKLSESDSQALLDIFSDENVVKFTILMFLIQRNNLWS